MAISEERRRFTRIEFASDANIEQSGNQYNVNLVDISLNGVLIETPEHYALNADETVDVNITLSTELTITMRSELVHSSSKYLGFQCESIDMESMSHLRRLIELNIDHPRASERVLEELISPD